MKQWITKQQILELVKDHNFDTENEFEQFIIPKLIDLFKIKQSQIDDQSVTTSFDGTLHNCADIVIRTDDDFRKAMIVIELKLTKSVDKFKNGNYEEAVKQLHKYCQDTRSPYGILLTEVSCAIYKNTYFAHDQTPKRIEENKIPSIIEIEDRMARTAFLEFVTHKKSLKYVYWFIAIIFVLYLLSRLFILWIQYGVSKFLL